MTTNAESARFKRQRSGSDGGSGKNKKKKRRLVSAHAAPDSAEETAQAMGMENEGCSNKKKHRVLSTQAESMGIAEETAQSMDIVEPSNGLELIRTLHDRDIDITRKIECAYEYLVHMKNDGERASASLRSRSWMKQSNLILDVFERIESILVFAETRPWSDARSWFIIHWCLQFHCQNLQRINFSPKLMRPVAKVLAAAAESEPVVTQDLLRQVDKVVRLLFGPLGRCFRPGLDLWCATALEALSLGKALLSRKEDNSSEEDVAPKLVCIVLESFSRYIASHPSPKNVFAAIVNKMLSPLLLLLVLLSDGAGSHGDGAIYWKNSAAKAIEDICLHGLFHAAHIDGCLDVCSKDGIGRSQKSFSADSGHGSYHRTLFRKLELLKSEGNFLALQGTGTLMRLYVRSRKIKLHAGTGFACPEKITSSKMASEFREQSFQETASQKSVDAEVVPQEKRTNRSVFNLFEELMEPLLTELELCQKYANSQENDRLGRAPHTKSLLVAINGLLSSLKEHAIYVPTQDTAEQSHFKFLKRIFDAVFCLGSFILVPLSCESEALSWTKLRTFDYQIEKPFMLIMMEIVSCLRIVIEVEYRVADENLLDLWLLLLCYLTLSCGRGFPSVKESTFFQSIIGVSCQIIQIYGELRQVDRPLFTLFASLRQFCFCTAIRENMEEHFFQFLSSIPRILTLEASSQLLHSNKFLNTVGTVISTLPEGQVAQTIKLLRSDAMDTFEWVKMSMEHCDEGFHVGTMQNFSRKAEVAGKILSEGYIAIIESTNVTANNSILVGNSVNEIIAGFSGCLGILLDEISKCKENLWERLLFVFIEKKIPDNFVRMHLQSPSSSVSVSWCLVLLLRLYISCRSLYRQCICCMPPKQATKSSLLMGDSLTAFSGNLCFQGGKHLRDNYFSWINKPFLSVVKIIATVLEGLNNQTSETSVILLSVLQKVAIQRIFDINRHLSASEFLLDKLTRMKFVTIVHSDDPSYKQQKHLEKHIKVIRKEASDLTEFLLKSGNFANLTIDEIENCQLRGWNSIIGCLTMHSLPTAAWQLLCINIDIWSQHASKRSLKKFVSNLLDSFVHFIQKNCLHFDFRVMQQQSADQHNILTIEEISCKLLQNTVFYEQKFLCRYLAKKVCQRIRAFLGSRVEILSDFGVNMNTTLCKSCSGWPDFNSMLEEIQAFMKLNFHYHANDSEKMTSRTPAGNYGRGSFQNLIILLHLLCWLPKHYARTKDLAMLVCHILNIERFMLFVLLKAHQMSINKKSTINNFIAAFEVEEYIHLFVACRETLNSIISDTEDGSQRRNSLIGVLLVDSCWKWLSRSIVIFKESSLILHFTKLSMSNTLLEDTKWARHLFNNVLNLTSQIFMFACGDVFRISANSFLRNVQGSVDAKNAYSFDKACQTSSLHLDCNESVLPNENQLNVFGNSLKIEAERILFCLNQNELVINPDCGNQLSILDHWKETCYLPKVLSGESCSVSWIELISLTGSIKSMIWGLASALDNIDKECRQDKTKTLKWQDCLLVKWRQSIDTFQSFINMCINRFLIKNLFESILSFQDPSIKNPSKDDVTTKSDLLSELTSSGTLNEVFLNSVLKEESDQATLLGELFMALAGIVKLKHLSLSYKVLVSETNSQSTLVAFMDSHLEAAFLLLLKGTTMLVVNSTSVSLSCMFGIIKFLECIGTYAPFMRPAISTNVFKTLLNVHLQVMASMGFLTLEENTRSTEYPLYPRNDTMSHGSSLCRDRSTSDWSIYGLKKLRCALMKSFTMLVRKPNEFHLKLVLKYIERSLAGVSRAQISVCSPDIGNGSSGRVSKMVAAAVECLDLLLDSISGPKRLQLLADYSSSFVSAIINIIMHLQGPHLFFGSVKALGKDDCYADSTSVTLKCIEVLSKVASRHMLFQLNASHVSQSLAIPAVIFEHFCHSWSKIIIQQNKLMLKWEWRPPIALYTSSCRLLCSLLRHRKRDSERCMCLLEDSLRVLLFCLEIFGFNASEKSHIKCLIMNEGVECASWLRRIYEELSQHKDVLSRYYPHMLSDYVTVLSGFGPERFGLSREIDESLRPGVYALVDVCTLEDLQQLHAVLGEGPARNALKALKLDYEKYFKYSGKI